MSNETELFKALRRLVSAAEACDTAEEKLLDEEMANFPNEARMEELKGTRDQALEIFDMALEDAKEVLKATG